MRTDRLLKLADFLESIPRRKFVMSAWQDAPATKPEGKKEGGCGFAGCAVGWAVHTKLFRGLKFVEKKSMIGLPWTDVSYYGEDGFHAPAKLFGIAGIASPDKDYIPASEYLFAPESYDTFSPTPKQVAKRIRAFIKATSSSSAVGAAPP